MRLLPERRKGWWPDQKPMFVQPDKGKPPERKRHDIPVPAPLPMTPYQKARQAEDRERVCPKK